jgi:hypothetical protein
METGGEPVFSRYRGKRRAEFQCDVKKTATNPEFSSFLAAEKKKRREQKRSRLSSPASILGLRGLLV